MRTEKVEGLTVTGVPPPGFPSLILGYYDYNEDQNYPTTRYYYDGQMMVEDDFTTELSETAQVTVMRYGIGARGIDFLTKRVDAGEENRGFPLYDGHGNMIATLGRSENSPYFGVADLRSYDVWGAVRSGSTTGDPKQRYCANLGHVQDDESGLIYMRARYYEPWSGRFISEDTAGDGVNWYVYAGCDPILNVDSSGNESQWSGAFVWLRDLLKGYGELGRYAYDVIVTLSIGAMGCLTKAMLSVSTLLIRKGNKEALWGLAILGIVRAGGPAAGPGALLARKHLTQGIMAIALGWMLRIATVLLDVLFANDIVDVGDE
ncbi:MAG: hypothetical protein AMXMBFR19_24000 [Chthonomonadaceae bacterium]|uniref:RHS repeat-associated core domain-containing protein n=1 Tax=Candidatus Nitrosymbiomonas proteolyticus TaxID=2608984 RepID=A0A809RBQ2_9BACT|nr:conserved hypothetical protein [Candidatus Nitrosymbiomonas proteolyticus]